ncbi:hypothetical protein NIES4074_24080 [Cylindrospermum sp. NIES-4074]|nr:hypothetical protein NIES4074_24080 [Cylindrospermum sp. NIES-4074]
MTIRAKFTVQFNRINSSTQVADVVMSPVLATTEENLAFWEATPAGQISLQITNPKAAAEFEVGADIYVDFTRATPREPDTAIWKQ